MSERGWLVVLVVVLIFVVLVLLQQSSHRGEDCPPGQTHVWAPGKWICVPKGG